VNLLKDVHDAVSSLVKSGTVVRIARGYYCIKEE
jgi:predicted transcriptional regulator of viral defense system